jgi:hypothetical protein
LKEAGTRLAVLTALILNDKAKESDSDKDGTNKIRIMFRSWRWTAVSTGASMVVTLCRSSECFFDL